MSHGNSLCGPDCRYRSLYEGSQASLADMASKQAGSLGRVGRLREGIVAALKQTFPTEFSDAETQMGTRMGAVDDEVLLAYVTAFVALTPATTAARSTSAAAAPTGRGDWTPMREALSRMGLTLPVADDPALWAKSIDEFARRRTPPPVTVSAPATAGASPSVSVTDARLDQPVGPAVPAGRGALGGGFADLPPDPGADPSWAAVPDPPDDIPGAWADLSSVFDSPEDLPPPPEGYEPAPYEPPAPASAPWEDLFSDDTPGLPDVPAHAGAPGSSAGLSTGLPEAAHPVAELEHGSVAPEAPEAVQPVEVAAPAEAQLPASVTPPKPRVQTGTPTPATPATPAISGNPGAVTMSTPSASLPPNTTTTATSGPLKPVPLNTAPPKKSTRRKPVKRTARVSAATPTLDPRGAVADAAAGGELTDELRDRLLACVCMARPVFMADLVHLVGDAGLVEQWERECRAQGKDSPIRFITAKPRHKARGHLVIPFSSELRSSTTDFEKSTWNKIISHPDLRGAKLYELAVLLHRVLDQVVTFDVGTHLVTMRINQSRGLVGVVLMLTTDLQPDTEARVELGEALTSLTGGRLSLLAVCSYGGGNGVIPELADTSRALVSELGLSVSFPMIAQASWEFASDGGTSAVSILGGGS